MESDQAFQVKPFNLKSMLLIYLNFFFLNKQYSFIACKTIINFWYFIKKFTNMLILLNHWRVHRSGKTL